MEAEILLEYDDAKTAEAIAKAVSPDNFKTPHGMFIKTVKKNKAVMTSLRFDGKLATLIATIDDLLFCTTTAENTLKTAKKLK